VNLSKRRRKSVPVQTAWFGLLPLAWCLSAFACPNAAAGGRFLEQPFSSPPNPVGSGARALGQGNAFIAVADDATAASWNPAGLAQLERPEISFALDAVWHRDRISSDTFEEVDTTAGLNLASLNYASLVQPFYWLERNWAISANYLRLYSFDSKFAFPVNSTPSNLQIDLEHRFEQEGEFSVVSPAIACDVTPRLALGLALYLWDDNLTHSSSYRTESQSSGTYTTAGTAIPFTNLTRDSFTVTGGQSLAIGGLYRMDKNLALGMVFKPAFSLRLEHHSRVYSTQDAMTLQDTLQYDDQELEFPAMVGLGLACYPKGHWTLAMDICWTDWSAYQRVEDGRRVNPLTGRAGDRLADTWTCRLGCETIIVGKNWLIPLRCGLGYDPEPRVDGIDDFYTISLGGGFQRGPIMLDLAYEYRFGNDTTNSGLAGLDASQDVRRHRLMLSLIGYF
jgi:long-subunit fatty acid transport protein